MAKIISSSVKFAPGDTVKWGPHECTVGYLRISRNSIMYQVQYWGEGGELFQAEIEDWEAKLIEEFQEDE